VSNQFGYYRLYTDGGLLSKNPSDKGGTWAWVCVDEEDNVLAKESGIVLPHHIDRERVTNNQSELTAIYRGLRSLPNGWQGQLWSDSRIALQWIGGTPGRTWTSVPRRLSNLVIHELHRNRTTGGRIEFMHLDGHREGSEFHKFNVMCDRMCNEERAKWDKRNEDGGSESGRS
jgi:ribonuclease HI